MPAVNTSVNSCANDSADTVSPERKVRVTRGWKGKNRTVLTHWYVCPPGNSTIIYKLLYECQHLFSKAVGYKTNTWIQVHVYLPVMLEKNKKI